uniref:Uncharacterized protein n=1 Tax=viral metagenome TaxID=1070528 RepID=A0A6C0D2K4_9ZZZZ
MSNSKKTVKSEFSNMYGNGKNLNVGKNKSTNELLNNIKNSDLNKNLNLNTNIGSDQNETQRIERKTSLTIPEIANIGMSSAQSPFKFLYIIIILIIVMIIGLLFYYKDLFMHYFNMLFSNTPTPEVKHTNEENPTKSDITHEKVEVTHAKVESTSAKIDDLDKKVDKLIESKTCSNSPSTPSTINTLNEKINNVSPYKEANVTADGFCYIGYDNGQRECVDVYAGDVCMSGEIFPSLDICINPKMRK